MTKKRILEAKQEFTKYKGFPVYVNYKHTSQSGNTTILTFFVAPNINEIMEITSMIPLITDYAYSNKYNGIITKGFGYDKVSNVLKSINYSMLQFETGKTLQQIKAENLYPEAFKNYFFDINNYIVI